MSNQIDHNNENDEISLKELILLAQTYIKELFKYWWIITICGFLFAGIMLINEMMKPITYTSSLTFMMQDEGGGANLGGVASLLGSFGFGGGENNADKMMKLIKSRTIIQQALFAKTNTNGRNDYFANHLMEAEEIEVFTDEEETDRFYFKRGSFKKTDTLENSVLMGLHGYLVGSPDVAGTLALEYDETSGIITMYLTSKSEHIGVEFLRVLFDIVDEYYVRLAIEKNARTLSILESKADSLSSAITSAEFRAANFEDTGRLLQLRVSQLEGLRAQKDIKIGIEQYAEVLKNKEIAEFSLNNITPVIQALDLPIYPIFPNTGNLPKAIVIGGFIGGFLSVLFVIARKVYLDTMKNE